MMTCVLQTFSSMLEGHWPHTCHFIFDLFGLSVVPWINVFITNVDAYCVFEQNHCVKMSEEIRK